MTFVEKLSVISLEKFDAIEAVVIKETFKGAILRIEDDLHCFAYTSIPVGTKVLATIRKINYERNFITASIDSVLQYIA